MALVSNSRNPPGHDTLPFDALSSRAVGGPPVRVLESALADVSWPFWADAAFAQFSAGLLGSQA